VLIIAITIMGLGFTLMKTSLSKAGNASDSMRDKLSQQINSVMTDKTSPMNLVPETLEMEASQTSMAMLGIRNLMRTEEEFRVIIGDCTYYDFDGNTNEDNNNKVSLSLFDDEQGDGEYPYTIKRNQLQKVAIIVSSDDDAVPGLYECEIDVDPDQDIGPLILYVKII